MFENNPGTHAMQAVSDPYNISTWLIKPRITERDEIRCFVLQIY